jgi:rare lipoprotein A
VTQAQQSPQSSIKSCFLHVLVLFAWLLPVSTSAQIAPDLLQTENDFYFGSLGTSSIWEDLQDELGVDPYDHFEVTKTFSGKITYYSKRIHGRRTASGERHDKNDLVAAHRTLPFGTLVRVICPATEKSVVVRINDRGPFGRGKVLDLSYEAAQELGMIGKGILYAKAEVLRAPESLTLNQSKD